MKTYNKAEKESDPLMCDPETGVCEIPGIVVDKQVQQIEITNKPVKITYYTDPICSSCWGIEPQLRKLKLEYGDDLEIDYRMGGLLPDWSYNSGGISKPSDVAGHWEEVSAYYEMPIVGGVWLNDPLDSSYPPSIAVKAAQIQDDEKAIAFLRKLREFVFLDERNITRWEVIAEAAEIVGLDIDQLKQNYDGVAKTLFEEDLAYGRKLGVRGFPTMFFSNGKNDQVTLYGFRPYADFENAVLKVFPEVKKKEHGYTDPIQLFKKYPTLALKEYTTIMGISDQIGKEQLEELVLQGKLEKQNVKTGVMYKYLK
ncbi:DsbA family protein [Pedobacter foliorum]|uniref:DsbA family protein n=1 Tax=Pedobacter foliorum TaxID=2739058 RepID=UPI001FEC2911|nr:DsbA family protein [Pedobacter foliorum]